MDYASLIKFLAAKGFVKLNTETQGITIFKTVFRNLKENRIIIIDWELGGYVKNISSGDADYDSEKFFETFV